MVELSAVHNGISTSRTNAFCLVGKFVSKSCCDIEGQLCGVLQGCMQAAWPSDGCLFSVTSDHGSQIVR